MARIDRGLSPSTLYDPRNRPASCINILKPVLVVARAAAKADDSGRVLILRAERRGKHWSKGSLDGSGSWNGPEEAHPTTTFRAGEEQVSPASKMGSVDVESTGGRCPHAVGAHATQSGLNEGTCIGITTHPTDRVPGTARIRLARRARPALARSRSVRRRRRARLMWNQGQP